MTREEILAGIEIDSDGQEAYTRKEVLQAMSEFAQQEVVAATHPLQEKINGLREYLGMIKKMCAKIRDQNEIYLMADKAIETYK